MGSARPARARGLRRGAARSLRAAADTATWRLPMRRCPSGCGQSMLAPKIQGRILAGAGRARRRQRRSRSAAATAISRACLSLLGVRDTIDRYSSGTHRRRRKPISARCRARTWNSRRATRSTSRPWASSTSIAVTGSLPRLRCALRALVARSAAVCSPWSGIAPVMDAILVRRVDEAEWIRESLFETVVEPLINAAAAPRFRVLMMPQELTPREFLDRRAAGDGHDAARRTRGLGDAAGAGSPPRRAYSDGTDRRSARRARPQQETVVICRSGGRSPQVAQFSGSARVLRKSLISPAEFWPGPGI